MTRGIAEVRALRGAPPAVAPRSLVDAVIEALVGWGPLAPLLAEPGITDVLVSGPDEVWVDGPEGLRRTQVRFDSESAVRAFLGRLALVAGERLDRSRPFVDADLAGGIRLHGVIPPVVERTTISLRIPPPRGWTLAALAATGSVSAPAVHWLRALVHSRRTLVVCGGTGTGKTSLLGALLSEVSANERIVVIEQTPELRSSHPHVVALRARSDNSERVGAIELADLVRQSLRMRPDRIVVGEVRGPEIADLFAAFNSGHVGGGVTLHANSAADVPARLEALATSAGMAREAAHAHMLACLDAVVEVGAGDAHRRQVLAIHVVTRSQRGLPVVVPAVRFTPSGVILERPGLGLRAAVSYSLGNGPIRQGVDAEGQGAQAGVPSARQAIASGWASHSAPLLAVASARMQRGDGT